MSSSQPLPPDSEPIRTTEVGWLVILLFIGVDAVLSVVLLIGERSGPLVAILGGPEWRQNMIFYAVLLGLVVGGILLGIGRLRPSDLGLRRSAFSRSAIVVLGVWLLIQLIAATSSAATSRVIYVAPAWLRDGVGQTLLWTLAMFAGAALFEEVVFRGFLLPQFYFKFKGSNRTRLWLAIGVSQFLFAISHIPGHLIVRHLSGSALWSQLALQGLAGVLLALAYLRTRSLWVSIGFHGLANAPTPLVRGTESWETFLIVLIVIWPWLVRRTDHRGLAPIEDRRALDDDRTRADDAPHPGAHAPSLEPVDRAQARI